MSKHRAPAARELPRNFVRRLWIDRFRPARYGIERESDMITVIATTQFAFIALGIMAVKVIVMSSGGEVGDAPLAEALNANGLWLFLLPFLWMLYAQFATRLGRFPFLLSFARASGVAICVGVFVVFGLAIYRAS